jgi:hypothetical protein
MPDQKLKTAMAEIKVILEKHDIVGVITLASETHAEFRYLLSASWSVAYFEDPCVLRIRAKKQDFATPEQQQKCVELTIGAIHQFRDISMLVFDTMEKLIAMLKQQFQIDHQPFKDFEPHEGDQ